MGLDRRKIALGAEETSEECIGGDVMRRIAEGVEQTRYRGRTIAGRTSSGGVVGRPPNATLAREQRSRWVKPTRAYVPGREVAVAHSEVPSLVRGAEVSE